MRLLLVEDNEDDVVLIRKFLSEAPGGPYRLEWAECLAAARERAAATACDLVLLDLSLPDSQGLETFVRMQQSAPGLPIIVLTGLNDESVVSGAVHRGAQDYLVKGDFTPEFLARVIRYAIERKQAEQELLQSQERFRAIIENGSDIIVVMDGTTAVTFASPSVERLLGFTPKELAGTRFLDLVHPEHHAAAAAVLLSLAHEPGASDALELRVRDTAGAWHWLEATGHNLLHHPAVRGVVVNARDLTERHRAQEALTAQLTRLDLLNDLTRAIAERQDLDSMFRVLLTRLEESLGVDACCILTSGGESGTMLVAANGAASDSLNREAGLEPGTVIDTEAGHLRRLLRQGPIYAADFAEHPAPVTRQLARVGLRSGLATALRADDRLHGVLVTARRQVDAFSPDEVAFLRRLGEHIALAIRQSLLFREVQSAYDELKRTQQAVVEQERLRVVGQMASGIAHDINNSLTPITTYAELLLERVPDLSGRARKYAGAILTAAGDIRHTVARMRELYRGRDERDELVPIHLRRFVRDLVDLNRPRWQDLPQQQGVTVEVECDLDPEVTYLYAVESELREALTNLIGNAVDAMPAGGVITLRSRRLSEEWVAIEVADTGTGMDEETRARCLDPFFTTKGDSGTGLGLSMVHSIMQRHEGFVEIETEPRLGTTIRLRFPVRDDAAGTCSAPETEGPAVGALRILCVDDDAGVREAIVAVLRGGGHSVEVAGGGEAGLMAFQGAQEQGTPFDVVFTDLGMPHVDGRMVALGVKARSPETPVVLLTGWGMFMETDSLPEGVDAILAKPPDLTGIQRVLASVAARPSGAIAPEGAAPAEPDDTSAIAAE